MLARRAHLEGYRRLRIEPLGRDRREVRRGVEHQAIDPFLQRFAVGQRTQSAVGIGRAACQLDERTDAVASKKNDGDAGGRAAARRVEDVSGACSRPASRTRAPRPPLHPRGRSRPVTKSARLLRPPLKPLALAASGRATTASPLDGRAGERERQRRHHRRRPRAHRARRQRRPARPSGRRGQAQPRQDHRPLPGRRRPRPARRHAGPAQHGPRVRAAR